MSSADCLTNFTFPMTFPMYSMSTHCDTFARLGSAELDVPGLVVDVVNTFHPPAGSVAPATLDLVWGTGDSVFLSPPSSSPTGPIGISHDVSPGTGAMDFAANSYQMAAPVVLTLANYPGQQYRTTIQFQGSLQCYSRTYAGEVGEFIDVVLAGTGIGFLPPGFPVISGQPIKIITIPPPGAVPAFGPLGLFTLAVGIGGLGLWALKLRKERREAIEGGS